MNQSVTIIEGEASESDEERPVTPDSIQKQPVNVRETSPLARTTKQNLGTTSPSDSLPSPKSAAKTNFTKPKAKPKVGHSPAHMASSMRQRVLNQHIVVSGEAPESSEEEIEIDTSKPPSPLTALRVDKTESGDSVVICSEGNPRTSFRQSQSSDREPDPKYDTLLHGKLRERNVSLRRHLCDALGQAYLASSREVRDMTQALLRSQVTIQDVSYNMGVLTNKLFQLEDKIDIITSCNLLPIIDVSPALTPTASAASLPGH